ncbi:MAG: energy-coupling factor transporter ATPase [Oscillospiraceae bacterium]|nr:energy-coupling factor transporter ATPase [Oscillospiraceae bacterium]
MSELCVKTEKLTFHYPPGEGESPRDVLREVDIEIAPGTFTVILGHNGSGKSTLARQLNALLLPSGGSVTVFGMDTADEKLLLDIRRRVGMVFQNPDNQIVSNVVEEDVAFAPENLGCPTAEIRRRVDEALKTVGMYDYREHAPHLLSGGQKQRVAIAGVLAMEPQCVVFDEATAMLDPGGRRDVIGIINTLRQKGVTVILITHHMDEAVGADKVIVMNDGRVALEGTPREVFRQVENLKGMGLTVPDTAELIWRLRQKGLELDPEALTVDECAAEIAEALR